MTAVKLTDIRKSYDKIEVIHGVDLAINQGEFIVFVGPSGCGKSTLLRMIAGLESITQGEMEIDGVWHTLQEGDSFRIQGEAYRWRNRTDRNAVVIWVIAPPVY